MLLDAVPRIPAAWVRRRKADAVGLKKRNDEVDYTYVAEMVTVMKHPMRLKALMEVGRSKYPINPVVIAKGNKWPVNDVAYHVRTLRDFGAVELVDTEPVRGATKHLYVIKPFGEEILAWAKKMERYGRKRARERNAVLGQSVKAEREKAGLTRGELAERSGLKVAALSALEKGKTIPDTVALFKLGSELGINLGGEPPTVGTGRAADAEAA